MKKIPLTQGYFALVDDEDYKWLSGYKWHVSKVPNTYYAYTYTNNDQGERKRMSMHRLILGLKERSQKQCDHIDGNGLNNQKQNLRICSHQQNTYNSKPRPGTSKYKGVCWNLRAQKWQVGLSLRSNGIRNRIALGHYVDEEQAAKAYDLAAIYYFGDFARTNFDKSDYEKQTFNPDICVKPRTKLTKENVANIIKLLNDGKTQIEIAKIFNVSRSLISAIKRRVVWRHANV